MKNKKKYIARLRWQTFCNKFSRIVVLQHQHWTLKDWSSFKQKISFFCSINKNFIDNENTVRPLEICNISNGVYKKIITGESKNLQNSKKSRVPTFISGSQNMHAYNKSLVEYYKQICQGPTLLIGCNTDESLRNVCNFIKSDNRCILICCLYKKSVYNHLDLAAFLHTKNSVYGECVECMEKGVNFVQHLQQKTSFIPLFWVQYNLLSILNYRKADTRFFHGVETLYNKNL